MSYTDKCCGVCDEYQDLYLTGTSTFWDHDKSYTEDYRRFYDDYTNVCKGCIENGLQSVSIKDLHLHKNITTPKNITKGFEYYIDPATKLPWKLARTSMSKEDLIEGGINPTFTKAKPDYYEVTCIAFKHEGLFTQGGVFCKDKRKLRKVLRKLGIIGKIESLIK